MADESRLTRDRPIEYKLYETLSYLRLMLKDFRCWFDVKKLRNEGRREAIFEETNESHFPQQLLHVYGDLAEITGS
ncbi:hypothetical protein F2Q70_00030070 [Brassica cretica]|uniref:Uncharacterized protein n=2 Tax=Brassica cretica TaxID=69181 RepID=A0A8S9FJ35_BRACR|nr:hypothetical protein F2Q70_00030070 [Brassica cretica]KAF2551015.1 hypothetical protein F2Q68_00034549 [Brassica cretica]KAF3486478.1 hypothetical protein F2Q69_00053337 [Brassica cretica]KAF3590953.1 hypothetical protein DY000_02022382 [Brassica cretica]